MTPKRLFLGGALAGLLGFVVAGTAGGLALRVVGSVEPIALAVAALAFGAGLAALVAAAVGFRVAGGRGAAVAAAGALAGFAAPFALAPLLAG